MVYQDRDTKWSNGCGVRVAVEDDCSVSVCVTYRCSTGIRTVREERPVALVSELVRFIEDSEWMPEPMRVFALQRLHVAVRDAQSMEQMVMYQPDAADAVLSWQGLAVVVGGLLVCLAVMLWG